MVSKNELEKQKQMDKTISKINTFPELIAFIWAYRRKEFLFYVNLIQTSIILFLLLKYTGLPKIISDFFIKFLTGAVK